MHNNTVTGNLSYVEIDQLEDWGVTVDLMLRDEIYKQSYSGSSEKMWTCGMKRLRLTNGDVWTYEPAYLNVPSTNVQFEGIDDGDMVIAPSSVSVCLNELYHLEAYLEQTRLNEVFLTQAEYNDLVDAGTVDPNTLYLIYE